MPERGAVMQVIFGNKPLLGAGRKTLLQRERKKGGGRGELDLASNPPD